MNYDTSVIIGGHRIERGAPTYFVADVASNHDGDEARAHELIHLAKDAGADAVKFQHFLARHIVSDRGFRALGSQVSHQAAWSKPVYEVYEQYELPRDWTPALARTAAEAGIDFLTTPYDVPAIELVDDYVPAYKIGSGDITWTDLISAVASRGKPVLLATGASTMRDVERAVGSALEQNRALVLMQCNTNYTGSLENFGYVNLAVLNAFAERWPGLPLGLSDHTPGHATTLGAVALGACVVEKHFTDDNNREGPDHPFSMNPRTWRGMVERARELEHALGDGIKRIEANERETAVVQRRCLRFTRDLPAGTRLCADDLEALRPAPPGGLEPYRLDEAIDRTLARDRAAGEALTMQDLV